MKFIKNHYKKLGYKGKYLDIRFKEFKKQMLISLIILVVGIIFICSFAYFSLFSDYNILDKFSKSYMNEISSVYSSDDIIIQIASLCSHFDSEENKLKCVNNFFKEFYNYDEHNDEIKVFRNPGEIINKGGVCRDSALFYSSVTSLLGFENEFIFEPHHVYNKICGEDCWIIDQTSIRKVS